MEVWECSPRELPYVVLNESDHEVKLYQEGFTEYHQRTVCPANGKANFSWEAANPNPDPNPNPNPNPDWLGGGGEGAARGRRRGALILAEPPLALVVFTKRGNCISHSGDGPERL